VGGVVHDGPDSRYTNYENLQNVYSLNYEGSDIDSEVERIKGIFSPNPTPESWQVGPSTAPPGVGSVLLKHGLSVHGTLTGMVAELPIVTPTGSGPVAIRRVTSPTELEDWLSLAFPTIQPDVRAVNRKIWKAAFPKVAPLALFLGCVDGIAVASSSVWIENSIAGVFAVATAPDYQKQGIGTAMTWHAIRRANNERCDLIALQSTDDAHSIYLRCGLRDVSRVELYTPSKETVEAWRQSHPSSG
jgi:ribosomal protein S18 acetylase RimI-like enzyme